MPQMGESITEGTIVRWFKGEGDEVVKDEPLLEISTDKVDAEVPAPAGGRLAKILHGPGTTVAVETVIGVIAQAGEAVERRGPGCRGRTAKAAAAKAATGRPEPPRPPCRRRAAAAPPDGAALRPRTAPSHPADAEAEALRAALVAAGAPHRRRARRRPRDGAGDRHPGPRHQGRHPGVRREGHFAGRCSCRGAYCGADAARPARRPRRPQATARCRSRARRSDLPARSPATSCASRSRSCGRRSPSTWCCRGAPRRT